MTHGERIIDTIVSGKLCHAQCTEDANHGVLVVWSSGAAEQLEAIAAIPFDGIISKLEERNKRQREIIERLERDLTAMTSERDAAVELLRTKELCDTPSEIVAERDALKIALEVIRDHGGAEFDGLSCNGSWCAEQARRALEAK